MRGNREIICVEDDFFQVTRVQLFCRGWKDKKASIR